MSTTMNPTLGDTVIVNYNGKQHAAIVTASEDDGTLSLSVHRAGHGEVIPMEGVKRNDHPDGEGDGWMSREQHASFEARRRRDGAKTDPNYRAQPAGGVQSGGAVDPRGPGNVTVSVSPGDPGKASHRVPNTPEEQKSGTAAISPPSDNVTKQFGTAEERKAADEAAKKNQQR